MKTVQHKFVEYIPDVIEEGILYISMSFATVVHKCACGCGREVVTPLGPTDWKLIFDGETVSLDPSIGNWTFECQSHYWIDRNEIRRSTQWSEDEIRENREDDWKKKTRFYKSRKKKEKKG